MRSVLIILETWFSSGYVIVACIAVTSSAHYMCIVAVYVGPMGNRAIEHRARSTMLLVPQGRAHHRCGQVESYLPHSMQAAAHSLRVSYVIAYELQYESL